ncbi:MAG: tetratricopeptide repeat protein [Snowella sp.]|nr:tetratricopeptide repeat protein [Snowella sp.]
MSENSTKSTIQKVFIIGSGIAFLGMMVLPMFEMLQQPAPQTQAASSSTNPTEELQKIAAGYQKVLEREPNNPTALQGLAEVRLKMGDLPGAVPPLEKLVQLYPQETQLKSLLEAIKQQVKTGKAPKEATQPKK